jgi:triacylglycerol lipase
LKKGFIRLIKTILAAGIILISIMGCLAQIEVKEEPKTRKKEIPEITFKNLSPPYTDYDYLKGSKEFGFQFRATSFNLVNAWWLAEVSTLVYAEKGFVRSRLERAGLPEVKFFDKRSTQCFVANNDKFAIVAFRGSEIWKKREKDDLSKKLADLKADVDIRLSAWEQGGKVHRGFMDALNEVWPDLYPYLNKLDGKGCKIWITGHSLGGALAVLCCGLYGKAQGVYTYGSPRVGDEDFKEHVGVRVYRIVNGEDIVPRIPSFFVFVHIGELKFIDDNGIIHDKIVYMEHPDNRPRDEMYGQISSGQPGNNSSKGFVPAPFRDHVPLLYAIHLWNNVIESRQ